MVTLETISNNVSACIVDLQTAVSVMASIQGNIDQYKKDQNADAIQDLLRASVKFFELNPPSQDSSLKFDIETQNIANDPYLLRLIALYSGAGKVLSITCTDGSI